MIGYGGPHVLPEHIAPARELMAAGLSLNETARYLGVLSRDLDLALWNWIGEEAVEAPRRPEPQF